MENSKVLNLESFGIKTGEFIRIPHRSHEVEKYFAGLSVVMVNYEQEIKDVCVITEVWNHEFHDDVRLASYNREFFINDGHVLLIYPEADPKYN